MSLTKQTTLKCMILAPFSEEFDDVRHAISSALRQSKLSVVLATRTSRPEIIFSEILNADLVIAVVSDPSPNVYYEVGLAHAAGKPIIFVVDEEVSTPLFAARFSQSISYSHSPKGFSGLQFKLRKLIEDFKRDPQRLDTISQLHPRPPTLPVVDLDRLEPRDFENLCFELLTQMGFRRLEWGKQLRDIDFVATLPKKDPDGFDYNELWLVSLGLRVPFEVLLRIAQQPDLFWRQLERPRFLERLQISSRLEMPITLLLILSQDEPSAEGVQQVLKRIEQHSRDFHPRYTLRLRYWDRQKLVSLIQQYPHITQKYFSAEARAQSTSRKSYEQLYRENISLSEQNQVTIAALKEERDKRLRAERDAVWKDVAFTAAHKLGNPIFALETNLQGIKRTISTAPEKASNIAGEMAESIEKAKAIIEQFKSLTKALEISPRPADLVPLLNSASRVAADNGVQVQVTADKDQPQALVDPARMIECFDELFANALHWLDKPVKQITVAVDAPKKGELPSGLDTTRKYVRVRFQDNGCGIAHDKKVQVFAPFFTTYPHGTGLGLALVQRVIEGHGGTIREVGNPDEGSLFELFLPQAASHRQGD